MPDISPARTAALDALSQWRKGMAGQRAGRTKSEDIIASATFGLERRDRALAFEIFHGVVRNLTYIDHALGAFITPGRKKPDPEVIDALRMGAYQLLFLDRVPSHAAVNEAVEQAKAARGKGAGSFVNGVLRSLIRGKANIALPDLAADAALHLSVKRSFPGWIAGRWVSRYGIEGADALMAASNAVPPLVLRANTLMTGRDALIDRLGAAGVSCERAKYAPDGIVVRTELQVTELPGYADGLFVVQDEAAQLVSILLGPKPGEKVLDACAAPGGKTAHIAAIAGGKADVTAADIGLDKLKRLNENISRLGLPGVAAVVVDAMSGAGYGGSFDRILLDAPCSALGIIRRKPEIKRVRSEQDVKSLAGTQYAMLVSLAGHLKPGGTLVYSTCSTEPDEGEDIIGRFVAASPGFTVEGARGFLPEAAASMVTEEGFMRSYPHIHGTDGFFAARITRKI